MPTIAQRRSLRRLAALAVTLTLGISACGGQRIDVRDPLYVLADVNGTLTVDVVDQSSHDVAGQMSIMSVGGTPPDGAVASLDGGSVLVTFTGSRTDSGEVSRPGTVGCNLDSSQCSPLWSGWGSATVLGAGRGALLVPAWNDQDVTDGVLARFDAQGGQPAGKTQLPPLVPGPVQLSLDRRFLDWLTYAPLKAGQPPSQEVVQVDVASGRVVRSLSLGAAAAQWLAIAPDGDVVIAMTYSRAPDRATGSLGIEGSSLVICTADLTVKGTMPVSLAPIAVAFSGSALMVAYAGSRKVDVFDWSTGHSLGSILLPAGSTLVSLSSVLDGGQSHGAVLVNGPGSQFQIGIATSAPHLRVTWQAYRGEAIAMGSN
jgi:hypothetical protein